MTDSGRLREQDFIHRFLPAQRQDAPLLLVLHGHGAHEGALVDLATFLAPAAHILSPRGQAREGVDARWWPRKPGVEEFTRADVVSHMEHLIEFVEDAIARYEISPRRVTAMGWSNGGTAAIATLLLRPDLIDDAVVFKPILPLDPDDGADLHRHAILIMAGRGDQFIPEPDTEHMADVLRRTGAAVDLHWGGFGHALNWDDALIARAWIADHLPWLAGGGADWGAPMSARPLAPE